MQQTVPTDATVAAGRFRALLDGYRERFDAEIAAWLAGERRRFTAEVPEADELAEAVDRLARSGGKRLRPALVWFTWLACGGSEERPGDADAVRPLAMSTELLHTYLLVHDDIMDHAGTRRGLPTAHAELARRHGERGWHGDAADFGRSAAILVGDLAHAWAHELAAEAARRLPPGRAESVQGAFAAASREVLAGQYLEVLLAQRGEATEDDLGRVLRLKSGAYTVERPMQLGALAAGAGAELTSRLSAYGRAVGEAFQLQDDVLGTFGDEAVTGKPAASDLAEGKLTFLVHHALAGASAAGAAELREALGGGPLAAARVARLRRILEESGALARVRAMIGDRLAAARDALGSLDGRLDDDGADFLAGLVDYVAERRE
jgi:geranylgeranyl diphosphate synthase type I